MTISFNAGEVLEIAQQIERNGARFYRRAAEAAAMSSASQTLQELAVLEAEHEQVFASMAAALSPEERQDAVYDPYDEAAQYMRAVAGGQVFDLRADPVEWLEGERTAADIFRKAIGLEKDSIIYYLGLKAAVPARLGTDRVDEIIRQEMHHVALLNTMLGLAEQQG